MSNSSKYTNDIDQILYYNSWTCAATIAVTNKNFEFCFATSLYKYNIRIWCFESMSRTQNIEVGLKDTDQDTVRNNYIMIRILEKILGLTNPK